MLEVFQEAITRSPVLDDAEDDKSPSVRDDREQAIWILKTLIENGWIELHADEISLTSTYSFSRIGRVFTQPMAELTGGRFRTRHRNTRNTCSGSGMAPAGSAWFAGSTIGNLAGRRLSAAVSFNCTRLPSSTPVRPGI